MVTVNGAGSPIRQCKFICGTGRTSATVASAAVDEALVHAGAVPNADQRAGTATDYQRQRTAIRFDLGFWQ